MHARPHHRKDKLPVRSLRDLRPARSLLLFDLAEQDWNISGPKGRGALEEMGEYPAAKNIVISKR